MRMSLCAVLTTLRAIAVRTCSLLLLLLPPLVLLPLGRGCRLVRRTTT